jgi:biopolymer transport protein ExbD
LLAKLQAVAQKDLSQVHIRGDQLTHFEAIDQVISTTKEAGIGKIAFVTTPPASRN